MTPRALVISAYKNVNVSGFTAIGDPDYDYKENPVVALQYRSQNITINGIKIRGFKKPVLILIYQADQIKLIILKFQILIFINLLQKEFQSVEASTMSIF